MYIPYRPISVDYFVDRRGQPWSTGQALEFILFFPLHIKFLPCKFRSTHYFRRIANSLTTIQCTLPEGSLSCFPFATLLQRGDIILHLYAVKYKSGLMGSLCTRQWSLCLYTATSSHTERTNVCICIYLCSLVHK